MPRKWPLVLLSACVLATVVQVIPRMTPPAMIAATVAVARPG